MQRILRNPVGWWSATNTPIGYPALGEYATPGARLCDVAAGREFEFVKIDLSGVSAYNGTPVVYVSTAKVTPDVSDAAGARHYSHVFAGVICASSAIVPTSGSTAYGWILVKGPLGKVAGSVTPLTLKCVLSTKGGSTAIGRAFWQSTVDGCLSRVSTNASASFRGGIVGYVAVQAASGLGSAKTSVAHGYIRGSRA